MMVDLTKEEIENIVDCLWAVFHEFSTDDEPSNKGLIEKLERMIK